ncbi:Uncharacterized protein TCM_024569 [Theobroma cacao]|uniref:RNase H type-1 domain-containing protein n=1 Tax=Theobroma cacao TaxID=3641 RepID=A0A061F3V4_THECC|nr:Uncharacterized protein TCM_024569 [Theobroma cacao]
MASRAIMEVLGWGLIRNSNGEWVRGFVLNIGSTDSLLAKLQGICEGLLLARSLQISSLVLEVDALVVVQFLTVGFGSSHPYGH